MNLKKSICKIKDLDKVLIQHQLKPDNSQQSKMLTQYLHVTQKNLLLETEALKRENEYLRNELEDLQLKRKVESRQHQDAMEELRLNLEEKIKKMLKFKDNRNKMLADSLQKYDNELNNFAVKCVEMEASVGAMKSENDDLRSNVESARKVLQDERMVLQIEKEQHEFEVNELKVMLDDVNEELTHKEDELVDKEKRVQELENMIVSKKDDIDIDMDSAESGCSSSSSMLSLEEGNSGAFVMSKDGDPCYITLERKRIIVGYSRYNCVIKNTDNCKTL